MTYRKAISLLVLLLTAAALFGCGGSNVVQNLSAEDRFALGKKKFDDEDYLEAITELEIVKLQFPGSAVADDAQFYLAECHFKLEEYLVAAEDYRALKRNMPASSFVPEAQYKVALCYYNLAPKSALDQSYAAQAIDEFQSFIEYNPTHELVHDAEAKIQELNTRLSRKLYETAALYMKMEYYKSATIYFDSVIEKFHDTEYAEPALFGKAQALFARKRYDEANAEIEKFLQKYPNSPLKGEVMSLQQDIAAHLKSQSAATSPSQSTSVVINH